MSTLPDKQLFSGLIQENKGIIYKVCNSYCAKREDRDDLAQEIVYQLWKSFPKFDPSFKFTTWMYRIALNVAISSYRKESRMAEYIPFSEQLLVFEDETDIEETDSNLALLKRFINELKEIDKSIMLLYLEDKSYKEIAEITGISETNVATKINRIKDRLKTRFQNIQNK